MTVELRPLPNPDPLASPALFAQLSHRYFVWDAFVAGERRVDLHPIVLSHAEHVSAVAAAEGAVRAVGRVAARAHADAVERELYGFSDDVLRLAAASHAAGDDASLMRVDLLLGSDGEFHVCEINADCPGGHNEATGLPLLARAAGHATGGNPTVVLDALVARLASLSRGRAVALVYATAYAEDLQVCALIQRALAARGVVAILCPPTAPRRRDGVLRVGDVPIGALYRFFPTECMDGQRNLPDLVDATGAGELRSLSSFAHMFTQSKVALGRAWSCAQELDADDADLVRRVIPATHDVFDLHRAQLIAERGDWVLKRALGRVGDEVFVGALWSADEWSSIVAEVLSHRAMGEAWVAQRFVPQRPVHTPWGDRFLTLGAYVLGGRFVGYFARVTAVSHVSHDALCLPVFTDPRPQ